jgi:hypothetical protein
LWVRRNVLMKRDLISKIVYWIYEQEVELNDPEETIDQILSKLKKDK